VVRTHRHTHDTHRHILWYTDAFYDTHKHILWHTQTHSMIHTVTFYGKHTHTHYDTHTGTFYDTRKHILLYAQAHCMEHRHILWYCTHWHIVYGKHTNSGAFQNGVTLHR